jgi:hypothetical protein
MEKIDGANVDKIEPIKLEFFMLPDSPSGTNTLLSSKVDKNSKGRDQSVDVLLWD